MIGVGSGFGDDAAGLAVVELLSRTELPAGVTIGCCARPLPDLLDAFDDAEAVVLVDATRGAGPPGHVHRVEEASIARDPARSCHGFGVAEALALARALGRAPRRVAWVGIEAGACRPGQPSSGAVQRALPEAAAMALELASEIGGLEVQS